MKKIGLSVDYSNICTDYNTAYLDRDNLDPDTSKCMKKVLAWSKEFITDLLEHFDYKLYHLSSNTAVKIADVSAKRFLFYSLEKEIMFQSYVMQKEYVEYDSLAAWEEKNTEGLLIQNDENGGAVYFYFNENSEVGSWIKNKLQDFSLDEVLFQAK